MRKPAGFHWDIFLLGITTGIAGILGIPFPNGLIPQAPFHTASLCVTEVIPDPDEASAAKGHVITKTTHVVEQRFSNLAQGVLTLGTMTGPLLIVLHLIPQGVLAGLFFVMGVQALEGNGMTLKILFLFRDSSLTPASEPMKRISRKSIYLFVFIQLVGFGATFAITQTIAAVGFPVFILLLIPIRAMAMTKWFTDEELRVLDGPTASPFTMESVGGNYGEDVPAAQHRREIGSTGGVMVDTDGSDEAAAERGEGPGVGLDVVGRRASWVGSGRGRRGSLEPHELNDLREEASARMRRRSISRQS